MTAPVTQVQLPEPNYPMVTRILTKPFFPPEPSGQAKIVACPHCKGQISMDQPGGGKDEPIHWTVGKAHPLVPNARVVRMFIEDSVVTIYSIATDAEGVSSCMRNIVPMSHVTIGEEAMPLDIFVEELNEAEEVESEPEAEVAPAPNGQPQSVS